jgi:hypothetical protein
MGLKWLGTSNLASAVTSTSDGASDRKAHAMNDDVLIDQLRHACSVALGDLRALGMPEGTSTDRLLLEALLAVDRRTKTKDAKSL